MSMLAINGTPIKDPSSFQWDYVDESSEESGRATNDGKAHKDIVASKRKLSCVWNNPTKEEVATILRLVSSSAFMNVTYPDSLSGNTETRTFYVGDRSTPMKIWTVGNKRYSSLSFNFIEQ